MLLMSCIVHFILSIKKYHLTVVDLPVEDSNQVRVALDSNIEFTNIIRIEILFDLWHPVLALSTSMTKIEIFSLLIAAAIHDYDHPGKTNGYLIATKYVEFSK